MNFLLSLALLSSISAVAAEALHPQEFKPKSEARDIAKIVATLEAGVQKQFDEDQNNPKLVEKDRVAKRDVHVKHHGCVHAKFTVAGKLPEKYAVGLFAKAETYDAIVRFSNGKEIDDRNGDVRGMAVKILGVPGEKLLEDERDAKTQDFLFINHNRFFIKNNSDYVKFIQLTGSGNPMKFFIGWNPLEWHVKEALIVREIRNKVVTNPLQSDYFTTVPSLMGQTPAKFSMKPCKGQKYETAPEHKDRLQNAMAAQLLPGEGNKGVCFEMGVQLQTSARQMPVEDSREEWSERLSPYRTVAKLDIEAQDFLNEKDGEKNCQNISMTPWHSLPEHRPIGEIQRTRKAAYQAISILRHKLNKATRIEP